MRHILIIFLVHFTVPFTAWGVNYYVNDNSLVGDMYSTAVGAAGNNGLSPATPKASVQAIITAYALAGGDIVYIDAGTYTEEILLSGISGAGTMITFRGAGVVNTILNGTAAGSNYVILMQNSSYIRWEYVSVAGTTGLDMAIKIYNNSDYNEVVNCKLTGYYGVDILRNAAGATNSPDYNKVHSCTINTEYVGVRVKSNRIGGESWPAAALVGPIGNEVYDNIIRVQATDVFAALEFQASRDGSAYRNHLTLNGRSTEGTVHIAAYSTNILIKNNYITHETAPSPGFLNSAVEADDNSHVDFIHNSVYSIGDCFHFEDVFAQNTLSNFSLRNNILYSLSNNCIELEDNVTKFKEADNNLYYAPAGVVALTGGVSHNYAAWIAYDPDVAALNEANGFYANPQYTSPGTSNLDLPQVSPAVDAVMNNIASVTDDIYQTSRPVGPAKDIGAFEWSSTLPVELLQFKAECTGNGAELRWSTSKEENNLFFSVERSNDGIGFTSIGIVQGAINSTVTTKYIYTDNDAGNFYYRLKQTDIDGSYSYSQVVHTSCLNESEVIRSQDGMIEVFIEGNGESQCAARIYSVNGQLLAEDVFIMHDGMNSKVLNISQGIKGIFLVEVSIGSRRYVKKVIF